MIIAVDTHYIPGVFSSTKSNIDDAPFVSLRNVKLNRTIELQIPNSNVNKPYTLPYPKFRAKEVREN